MSKATATSRKTTTIKPDHYVKVRANTHILYRCFTRKKLLLYVGMTNHPEHRFQHHQRHKTWWRFVDHITLERFPDRASLMAAESEAIANEKPELNVVVPQGPKPRFSNGRRLWPEASTFGVVTPEYGHLIDMTLEQQLYPCVECHARAIHCVGDTVECKMCSSEWPFDLWFQMTFGGDTPETGQMTLM